MAELRGVFAIDKPIGVTSQRALDIAKRALGERRIGHCGTLDPMATGLLLIATGKLTKLLTLLVGLDKSYAGSLQLGVKTDTDDITGKVICETDSSQVNEVLVKEAASHFVGPISQVPPQYSAVKVQGRRAYQLARSGHGVELAARAVNVYDFEIRRTDRREIYEFHLRCSSGTYVRSIVRDIGQLLGVGATMSSLQRNEVGPVRIGQAVDPSRIKASDTLLPVAVFPNARLLHLNGADLLSAQNGGALSTEPYGLQDFDGKILMFRDGEFAWDELVGCYTRGGDYLIPDFILPPV